MLPGSHSNHMIFVEKRTMDIYHCKSSALLSSSQFTVYTCSSGFYFCMSHCSTSHLPPANCSDPTPPTDGSIEAHQNTTEGAEICFRCNSGFVPARRMRAVCGADGRWNPDPATVGCTCEIIIASYLKNAVGWG